MTHINDGFRVDDQPYAENYLDCQAACDRNEPYCQSIDWDYNNLCWLFNTTEGKEPAELDKPVEHYDKICKGQIIKRSLLFTRLLNNNAN